MHRVTLAMAVAALFACTDPDRARGALEAHGFTHIKIGGHSWNRCGEGDSTCTEFEAIGPSGRPVTGAVGCGYSNGCGKGCTVRTD